jgi:hypothetical protein
MTVRSICESASALFKDATPSASLNRNTLQEVDSTQSHDVPITPVIPLRK